MEPTSTSAMIEALGAIAVPSIVAFWLLNYVLKRLDDMKSYQREIAELLAKILCLVEEGRK